MHKHSHSPCWNVPVWAQQRFLEIIGYGATTNFQQSSEDSFFQCAPGQGKHPKPKTNLHFSVPVCFFPTPNLVCALMLMAYWHQSFPLHPLPFSFLLNSFYVRGFCILYFGSSAATNTNLHFWTSQFHMTYISINWNQGENTALTNTWLWDKKLLGSNLSPPLFTMSFFTSMGWLSPCDSIWHRMCNQELWKSHQLALTGYYSSLKHTGSLKTAAGSQGEKPQGHLWPAETGFIWNSLVWEEEELGISSICDES